MAFYALGKEGIVSALDAQKGEKYWCLECAAPIKLRKRRYIPHFYHFSPSPQCRLYNKSEDHHLLQIQLQKLFPEGELEIEKPFLQINRVADLYWNREKIAFEIQCSSIELGEAQLRVDHYREMGCSVIWLLDDRVFNRRRLFPAEEWVRSRGAYYVSFKREELCSLYYDQFEVFHRSKRLKKGRPLTVDLRSPRTLPSVEWPANLPSRIKERTYNAERYFRGDLLDRAIRSTSFPYYALAISYWSALEKELLKPYTFWERLKRFFAHNFDQLLLFLLRKIERY